MEMASYYCLRKALGTRMWGVYLKLSGIFWTICCVSMLSPIIFTSPLLNLLGQTLQLAVLTGFLTLLIGSLGYIVFHWCSQISSKRVTVPISVIASSADEVDDDPCPPQTNYEVFISFRGEDTRDNFTSHLYDALCRKKIKTFIDNKLSRGEEISSTLTKTIEAAEIFVVIFSKNYASSTWCLDELVKILECRERYGRLVIPIFYNIDPSSVRKQTGSYANSFVKHSRRFKSQIDKVCNWKAALTQASNLSGLDSAKIRPEPKLIAKIVKAICKKLKRNSSYDLDGLVGIHDHISMAESLLNIRSQDVQVVGIWGMGGIGKTTIAEAIYHKLQPQFESCCFVRSVEVQLRTTELEHIRDKYIQELLEEEAVSISSFRSIFVKRLLRQKKILLVIDDVNKSTQIGDLIRQYNWFGPGSRVIITTRDMQVLRTANANEIYHVKGMSFDDALQLFSKKAFKQDLPIKNYMELSKAAVNYCEGNPLALIILGSFLYGRIEHEWENALIRLQNAPHMEIFEVLKLSFDGLDDDQKEIFLDIAVFYDGMSMESVKELLVSCGYFADIGTSVLIDRSLISIRYNEFVMHDLIRAMGREIARQPNVYKYFGTGRRLWKYEDIYHVLKKKKETEEIYGISLDASKIKEIYLRHDAFEKMDNLKIIRFYNSHWYKNNSSRLHISDGLKNFPEELKFFQWDEYPHTSVPLDSCASNIVELIMPNSHVKQLWDENQHLPNLKKLDLYHSECLTGILDLSAAPNIRYLDVTSCRRLSQVYSSGPLSLLQSFYGFGCNALKTVNIGGNNVQQKWRLHGVLEFFILNRFPEIFSGSSELMTLSKFIKVSLRILKSDSSNTYSFQFKYIPVPLTGISESESMDSDFYSDSVVLRLVRANLKLILPNLELISLYDDTSSLGFLTRLDCFEIPCMRFYFSAEVTKDFVRPWTFPEQVTPTESLCSPCMKGTGNKEAVSLSSWDWEEYLNGADDNSMEHNIHIRLPKLISNSLRWACLRQVSLCRSGILISCPGSIHNPSSLNSLSLSDYTSLEYAVELRFSLDSNIPKDVSEVSIDFAEQQNRYCELVAWFHGNRRNKSFRSGIRSNFLFYLDFYLQ